MPAEDHYHEVVKRALVKVGWRIADEQIKLIVEGRRLWLEMRAVKSDEQMVILVEVKGFENMPSPIAYLENTAGQYLLYRSTLDFLQIDTPLYLAVPEAAYNGILSETIAQELLRRLDAKLIVFDPEREEVMEWIDLTVALKEAMIGYTGKALNGYSYLTSSDDQQLFTVVSVGYLPNKRIVETDLIARVVGEAIIIELDLNNSPLVEALVQQGVPREQIVLAYAGEPISELS